jgi:hypothetical protein
VPRGSVSTEKSILTLYFSSNCRPSQNRAASCCVLCLFACRYLFQSGRHNLGAVVDGEDNVGDTSSGEGGNLVLNHGLVAKLDQRFGKSERLVAVSVGS